MRKRELMLSAAGLSVALLILIQAPSLLFAAENVTVQGELVDSRCFIGKGARGEEHQVCASTCAKTGLPVGVIEASGRYVTLAVQPQSLADYMALQARVEGMLDKEKLVLIPAKLEVQKDGKWVEVKLPKQMM